jgi:hypothetical protein
VCTLAVMLFSFLFKEGGPITAVFFMPAFFLLIVLVFPMIRFVYELIWLCICGGKPGKIQFEVLCF